MKIVLVPTTHTQPIMHMHTSWAIVNNETNGAEAAKMGSKHSMWLAVRQIGILPPFSIDSFLIASMEHQGISFTCMLHNARSWVWCDDQRTAAKRCSVETTNAGGSVVRGAGRCLFTGVYSLEASDTV